MNPVDNAQKLYRFIRVEELISIVMLHKESFHSPFAWEDKYEGYMLSKLKGGLDSSYIIDSLLVDESKDGLLSAISKYAKIWFATQCLYAQCWTTVSESDALWKIYSYDNHALRICSTKEKIIKTIQKKTSYPVEFGMVEYDVDRGEHLFKNQVRQMLLQDNAVEPLFHKRKAYEHEHEVRLIITTDDLVSAGSLNQLKKEYDFSQFTDIPKSREDWLNAAVPFILNIEKMEIEKGLDNIFIDIDKPSEYIESVLVHPKAPSWYVEFIKEICLTLGTEVCVEQSDFYK